MNAESMTPARGAGGWNGRVLFQLALFQAAWFACVWLAAAGEGARAVGVVAAAVSLHLALSDRLRADALLVAVAVAVGCVWDTLAVLAGWIAYASPGPVTGLAPPWILAMWALFATTLREPLRWMHGRPWLAALFGAVGGPLSYAAAGRLGACQFADPTVTTIALAIGWGLMMPALVAAARRLDRALQGTRA